MPTTDIDEQDGRPLVSAELPGLKTEDGDITLDQGDLVIRGECTDASAVKEDDYYQVERRYGRFYRSLPRDFDVAPEQITARYKDGVLEVQVPRPQHAQPEPHTIPVA